MSKAKTKTFPNRKEGEGFTVEEVAIILGITPEEVRKIEASAIRKMRNPQLGKRLKEYLEH